MKTMHVKHLWQKVLTKKRQKWVRLYITLNKKRKKLTEDKIEKKKKKKNLKNLHSESCSIFHTQHNALPLLPQGNENLHLESHAFSQQRTPRYSSSVQHPKLFSSVTGSTAGLHLHFLTIHTFNDKV